MKIELMDKFYFPETERAYTNEGYLIVPATISRPGTQSYRAIELVPTEDQLPNHLKPSDIITVYRPPSEVFKQESVDSFKNIAVTNNHPPEFLNSKNYKKYSVGIVLSDVMTDEKHVQGTLKVTDYDTINDIKDGKVDISAGYHSNIYFEDGETPDGEAYQAVQKDISGNHVAVVMRGRAGSEVKLADGLDAPIEKLESSAEPEEKDLGPDGVPGDNALNAFGDKKEITESTDVEDEENKNTKELMMKLEDAMTKIDELTTANEKLTSQVLDQAGIDTLVEDRMMLIDSCGKLVEGLEYMGKSNIDLKKEVLQSKMPNVSLEDKSPDYVNAAFDVLKSSITDTVEGKHDEDVYGKDLGVKDEAEVKSDEDETEVEDVKTEDEDKAESDDKVKVEDSVSVLDSAFETEVKEGKQSKGISAYEKYCEQSRSAWKK